MSNSVKTSNTNMKQVRHVKKINKIGLKRLYLFLKFKDQNVWNEFQF